MCIVVLNFQKHSEYPVQIAANREEQISRPQTPPSLMSNCLIAGEDHGTDGQIQTTGTWFGITANGMVVATTNRKDGRVHGRAKKNSRGTLCMELLQQKSVKSAKEYAASCLLGGGYGGVNFIIADRNHACVVSSTHKSRVFSMELYPGLFVISNKDPNDPFDERHKTIHRRFRNYRVEEDFLDRSSVMMSSERIWNPPYMGHGFRCSMLATIGKRGDFAFSYTANRLVPHRKMYISWLRKDDENRIIKL